MRQLTALDALFLAAENDRTHGHVSALGVYDAVTASGRPLDASLVRELVTERIHLLPPLRWRLAGVPFGLDHPYWVDEGTSTSNTTSARSPCRAGRPTPARRAGGPPDREPSGPGAPVVGDVSDPRTTRRLGGGVDEDDHAAVDGVSGAEVMSVLLDDAATGRELASTPAVLLSASPPSWRCWAAA